jgi:thymidylate synthase (FAD)
VWYPRSVQVPRPSARPPASNGGVLLDTTRSPMGACEIRYDQPVSHSVSVPAEQLLDHTTNVFTESGNHLGFVRLVDYLGSDDRIVQAARVSYGAGTRTVREDAALIDYLLRHDHTSPFEQVVLTFHLRMPIFVARQWLRHRTARVNEVSGRYSVMPEAAFEPLADDIAAQAVVNKQGRQDGLEEHVRERAEVAIGEVLRAARGTYGELLNAGVAREIARIVLPVATATEFYWQMDLRNLFHFLRLRLDSHAQAETRAFALEVAAAARAVAPVAFAAFEEHVLRGARLGGAEWAIVRRLVDREALVELAAGLSVGRRRELLALFEG